MKTTKSIRSIFSAVIITLAVTGACLNANAALVNHNPVADTTKMAKGKMKMDKMKKEKMAKMDKMDKMKTDKMDKMKGDKMKMDKMGKKMKMKKDSTSKM